MRLPASTRTPDGRAARIAPHRRSPLKERTAPRVRAEQLIGHLPSGWPNGSVVYFLCLGLFLLGVFLCALALPRSVDAPATAAAGSASDAAAEVAALAEPPQPERAASLPSSPSALALDPSVWKSTADEVPPWIAPAGGGGGGGGGDADDVEVGVEMQALAGGPGPEPGTSTRGSADTLDGAAYAPESPSRGSRQERRESTAALLRAE